MYKLEWNLLCALSFSLLIDWPVFTLLHILGWVSFSLSDFFSPYFTSKVKLMIFLTLWLVCSDYWTLWHMALLYSVQIPYLTRMTALEFCAWVVINHRCILCMGATELCLSSNTDHLNQPLLECHVFLRVHCIFVLTCSLSLAPRFLYCSKAPYVLGFLVDVVNGCSGWLVAHLFSIFSSTSVIKHQLVTRTLLLRYPLFCLS